MFVGQRVLGAALVSASLLLHPIGAGAQSFLDNLQLGYNKDDAIGAPRSSTFVSRFLLEGGYELRSPIVQVGAVYFASVDNKGEPECLMLDSFNVTILQTFIYTPAGLRALNPDSPGPGYPGYPPFSDGRYASACSPVKFVAPPPPPPPKPHVVRPPHIASRKHRHVKRKPLPACRPYQAPIKIPVPQRGPSVQASPAPDSSGAIQESGLCTRPRA